MLERLSLRARLLRRRRRPRRDRTRRGRRRDVHVAALVPARPRRQARSRRGTRRSSETVFPQAAARARPGRRTARAARGGDGPPAEGIDWYQVRTLGGASRLGRLPVGGGSPPKLPSEIGLPAAGTGPNGERTSYFTVSSQNGSTSYRVRASIEPQQPNRVLIVATSLNDVLGTLHRLLLIELIATIGVLAAIAGLGLWVVRLGPAPSAARSRARRPRSRRATSRGASSAPSRRRRSDGSASR